jgi:hypothetical protein
MDSERRMSMSQDRLAFLAQKITTYRMEFNKLSPGCQHYEEQEPLSWPALCTLDKIKIECDPMGCPLKVDIKAIERDSFSYDQEEIEPGLWSRFKT